MQRKSPWFFIQKPNPSAKYRLFCFPFAGGGTFIFRDWCKFVEEYIEIIAIELPGRERRFAEKAYENMENLIGDLHPQITPFLDKPYFIFGHSNGALIAYELLKKLTTSGHSMPIKTFLSSKRPPHLPRLTPSISHLPDDRFILELKKLEGTNSELLDNRELINIFLPTLRADFALGENYKYTEFQPLKNDIHLFCGTEDSIKMEEQKEWSSLFSGRVSTQELKGSHFHITSNKIQVVTSINEVIKESHSSRNSTSELEKREDR